MTWGLGSGGEGLGEGGRAGGEGAGGGEGEGQCYRFGVSVEKARFNIQLYKYM